MCSVGALHKPPSALRPYFGNRALEIARIREQLRQVTDELAPVCHIPGELNPADIGTRGLAALGDLGPGSTWQVGPAFLQENYEVWPQTVQTDVLIAELPPEECMAHCVLVDPESVVRNDGKLGGPGQIDAGDILVLSVTGSPGPPLLHEDKLSGLGAGGPDSRRLRQEGKLALPHEVKLLAPGVTQEDDSSTEEAKNPVSRLLGEIGKEGALATVIQAVGNHVLAREKLEVSVRVLARVLRAILQGETASLQSRSQCKDGRGSCQGPAKTSSTHDQGGVKRRQTTGPRCRRTWRNSMGVWKDPGRKTRGVTWHVCVAAGDQEMRPLDPAGPPGQ